VDVVLDLQEAIRRRVGAVDGVVPDVFACLDLGRAVVEVPLCVEVEVDGVVAEGGQDALAVPLADGVRGPHVRGEEAEDGVNGNLVPDHLVRELRVGQLAGVLVRPGVAGNLVPFGMHSLGSCVSMLSITNRTKSPYSDDGRIDGCGVIDLPLSEVGSRDEEGGFCSVGLLLSVAAARHVRMVSRTFNLSSRSLV
jgi:hypothetical protein